MSAGLIGILSIGVAAAALIASRIHSLRGVMRMEHRDLRDTPEIFFGAPGQPLTEAVGQLAVSMSERTRAPEGAEADRSPKQESHHVPDSRGGTIYDPRPPEDKARRRIAYPAHRVVGTPDHRPAGHGGIRHHHRRRYQGVRRDPWSTRGSGIGGHRLLLRNQAVAASGTRSKPSPTCAAESSFRRRRRRQRRQVADATATAGADNEPASRTLTVSPSCTAAHRTEVADRPNHELDRHPAIRRRRAVRNPSSDGAGRGRRFRRRRVDTRAARHHSPSERTGVRLRAGDRQRDAAVRCLIAKLDRQLAAERYHTVHELMKGIDFERAKRRLPRELSVENHHDTSGVVTVVPMMAPLYETGMQAKHQRTLRDVCKKPTPGGIRWADVVAMLNAAGVEVL